MGGLGHTYQPLKVDLQLLTAMFNEERVGLIGKGVQDLDGEGGKDQGEGTCKE
jgi:hypothetical protein